MNLNERLSRAVFLIGGIEWEAYHGARERIAPMIIEGNPGWEIQRRDDEGDWEGVVFLPDHLAHAACKDAMEKWLVREKQCQIIVHKEGWTTVYQYDNEAMVYVIVAGSADGLECRLAAAEKLLGLESEAENG